MKITNIANFKIDFITTDVDDNGTAISLNPGEFVYTVSDEKNISINLHGARKCIYIDTIDTPEGLDVLIPYTEESAKESIEAKVSQKVEEYVSEVKISVDNTAPSNPEIYTGSLQDSMVLTEKGKESVKLEEIVIEKSDPYADINIETLEQVETETPKPKTKKKPSSKKSPGRPKKRGPKRKKKPVGRPPGSKNRKR